nr:uncharacterized protein LOC109186382 [Ipomoea trifida]
MGKVKLGAPSKNSINHFNHPQTPYPLGIFTCDACKEESNGISYHCNPCGLDLHVPCAVLSLSVTHRSHHHPLQIIFPSVHSQTEVFSCDVCNVCKSLGQDKFWKYSCHSCDFDAHLNVLYKDAIISELSSGIIWATRSIDSSIHVEGEGGGRGVLAEVMVGYGGGG